MSGKTRMQKMQEKNEEIGYEYERAQYFADHPWDFKWKGEVNVQTRNTRKLFKDEKFQLLRPTITVHH